MKIRSREHLTFIRSLPCCIKGKNGHVCGGMPEAMHVRSSKDAGMGQKPGDQWTIPGCSLAHREQHQIGEPAFRKKYEIDMVGMAELLWVISPARFHDPDPPRKARKKAKKPGRKLTHPTLKQKVNGQIVKREAA